MSGRRVQWLGAIELFQPNKSLEDIVPEVRPKFEQLIAYAKSIGLTTQIMSAGRTCATQQSYYDLGEKVTQANLCRSMHVFGHAIDLGIVPNTCANYTKLGEWWEKQGGVWGGRWKQFGACGDAGHFHYGMNGAQAVPTSLCPSNVTEPQCREIREAYLTKAFNQPPPGTTGGGGMGLLTGLAIIAAGVGLVWATVNVKGGPSRVRENPRALRSGRELVILSHLAEFAPHADSEQRFSWAEYQLDRYKKKNPELWEALNDHMDPRHIAPVIADSVLGPRTAKVVR